MELKVDPQHIRGLGLEGVYWPPFDSLTLSLSQLRVSLSFSRNSVSLPFSRTDQNYEGCNNEAWHQITVRSRLRIVKVQIRQHTMFYYQESYSHLGFCYFICETQPIFSNAEMTTLSDLVHISAVGLLMSSFKTIKGSCTYYVITCHQC